ncbi:ATP-binding protein [bacterium]|nr:ATP-binding protein [bacterium]MCI0602761.1 ATP-binding protein [bacterium]
MHNSFRLIVVLFLIALVLHNYNSNKVLNLALDSLGQNIEDRMRIVAEQTNSELERAPLSAETLRTLCNLHKLDGIIVYGKGFQILEKFHQPLPGDLIQQLSSASNFPNASTHSEPYLVRRVNPPREQGLSAVLLLFNAERLFRIERSAKIINYLNLLVIGFAAILGFYFIESTLRPLRVLMQTARSAPSDLPSTGNRNDSDFLIGTFKGVIAKLKEKEQELNRLHQAEKARADDVEHLNQDLLRSIGSGLILIDRSGKIRVFNHAAEQILEASRLTAVNQPYESVVPKYSPLLLQDIRNCFAQKNHIVRAEMVLQTARGNSRFLSASIMPLQDRQQQFSGVFCIFSDITEFKMLQQHMAQKEKFASLGEMAAGVAHEFRNSIATVTGYLQMVEDRITLEQKTYIAPIHKEINSLQKVVNDFLSFAKPVQPHFEKVNLREIIQDCIAETTVTSKEVDFECRGEFPEIPGDEAMLRQVFSNLFRNAVEALKGTGRKGCVSVSGSVTAEGKASRIEIRDNGNGIRPEDLERIFTPFYSTKQDGVGLGLAIVQKLVLSHNGSIHVDSNPEGSVFRVHLPVV